MLQLLLAVCRAVDLSECKKLRAQLVADAIAAASAVAVSHSAAACKALRQIADALQKTVPVKQHQRVEQAVTKAIVAAKRSDGDAGSDRSNRDQRLSLLALSEEALRHVARCLPAPDLAAFCCTCRCEDPK